MTLTWAPSRLQRGPHTGRGARTGGHRRLDQTELARTAALLASRSAVPFKLSFQRNEHFALKLSYAQKAAGGKFSNRPLHFSSCEDSLVNPQRARVKEHRLAEDTIGLVCRLPRAQGMTRLALASITEKKKPAGFYSSRLFYNPAASYFPTASRQQ